MFAYLGWEQEYFLIDEGLYAARPDLLMTGRTLTGHANLAAQKRAIVLAVNDDEAIRAAYELTKLEGIIPALESAHALGALEKMKFKPTDIVVLTVSGRGDKDIETYLNNSTDSITE